MALLVNQSTLGMSRTYQSTQKGLLAQLAGAVQAVLAAGYQRSLRSGRQELGLWQSNLNSTLRRRQLAHTELREERLPRSCEGSGYNYQGDHHQHR